jgi:hypothetical protein
MAKVTQSICIDFEDWEMLNEIKVARRLKNSSQAIHFIIKQWQYLLDEARKRTKVTEKEPRKLVNPMVNP